MSSEQPLPSGDELIEAYQKVWAIEQAARHYPMPARPEAHITAFAEKHDLLDHPKEASRVPETDYADLGATVMHAFLAEKDTRVIQNRLQAEVRTAHADLGSLFRPLRGLSLSATALPGASEYDFYLNRSVDRLNPDHQPVKSATGIVGAMPLYTGYELSATALRLQQPRRLFKHQARIFGEYFIRVISPYDGRPLVRLEVEG